MSDRGTISRTLVIKEMQVEKLPLRDLQKLVNLKGNTHSHDQLCRFRRPRDPAIKEAP